MQKTSFGDTIYTVLLCLYVADPATLFSSENSWFIHFCKFVLWPHLKEILKVPY